MSADLFHHRIEFFPEHADALLRSIPAAPGVFALRGADPAAEPYLTRAADLRRRLRRILAPPEQLDASGQTLPSKRLNLRSRIRFIDYTRTGSDFESTLLLYRASRAAFGPDEARRRLRLYPPTFLRVTSSHEHPRVYTTNRLSKKSLGECFGPFPSRAGAERYTDAVLDLFQLRRCHEDLVPHPDHPGCAYGEMNKCLRPCQHGGTQACTPDAYAAEARRVHAFFATRGQSLLDEVAAQREAASEAMDFEAAAALHKHWEKVRAAALLADELVRPVTALRAVILQEAAPVDVSTTTDEAGRSGEAAPSGEAALPENASRTEDAAVFLLERGQLVGPARLSTLGVRAVREQTAVGSSLFAQPLMLSAIPLDEPISAPNLELASPPEPLPFAREEAAERSAALRPTTLAPEDRARALLKALTAQAAEDADIADLCDALSLFRRWYYRPEKQRTGEIFLPSGPANLPSGTARGDDDPWPIRRILNGAARVVLGPPTPAPPVDRDAAKDAAKALKTKIIHAGREGVEREVPVLPRRPRTRKAVTPADVAPEPTSDGVST